MTGLSRSNLCPKMRPARFPKRFTQPPLVVGDYGKHLTVALIRDASLAREVEACGIWVRLGDREEGASGGALPLFPQVHSRVCVWRMLG